MYRKFISVIISTVLILSCAACGHRQFSFNEGNKQKAYTLTSPTYPDLPPYPAGLNGIDYDKAYKAWHDNELARSDAAAKYKGKLDAFMKAMPSAVLVGKGTGNTACSPVNVYLALAMLAECTDGSSRAQILKLLGAEDLEELRSTAGALWKVHYHNDGQLTEILASSAWLNKDYKLNSNIVSNIAPYYHASVFQGKMTDENYAAAFREWLNSVTGGMIKGQIEALEPFSPENTFVIASSLYFKGAWASKFNISENRRLIFHAPSGDIKTVFMKSQNKGEYYRGDSFSAVTLGFKSGTAMWILLPDEGCTPEDLLSDPQALSFIIDPETVGHQRSEIHLALPKFDVTSSLSLIDSLKSLGIEDVFDPSLSDFSPVSDTTGMYVNTFTHDLHVKIDENGCEAVAYTTVGAVPVSQEFPPEVDFTVDRPFLAVISGNDGLPLFTAIINEPL